MPATRTTAAINEDNWKRLKHAKNRSREINAALAFMYRGQEFLRNKEEEFLLTELADYRRSPEQVETFAEVFGEEL